jgi:ubiquinone/menaquinone biosynthesis C-methylase UbiE
VRRARQVYYDAFSTVYDRFVAMHSGDAQMDLRGFLAGFLPGPEAGAILDLCTGTGAMLPFLHATKRRGAPITGLDFSRGMLRRAASKVAGLSRMHLVQGNAGNLPFADGAFGAVTCSHAFYELRGDNRERALQEIVRVLAPGGIFLMMEHDVPDGQPAKALFFLRLAVAGGGKIRGFLSREMVFLGRHFATVEKIASPSGRSKVMVCVKGPAVGVAGAV